MSVRIFSVLALGTFLPAVPAHAQDGVPSRGFQQRWADLNLSLAGVLQPETSGAAAFSIGYTWTSASAIMAGLDAEVRVDPAGITTSLTGRLGLDLGIVQPYLVGGFGVSFAGSSGPTTFPIAGVGIEWLLDDHWSATAELKSTGPQSSAVQLGLRYRPVDSTPVAECGSRLSGPLPKPPPPLPPPPRFETYGRSQPCPLDR